MKSLISRLNTFGNAFNAFDPSGVRIMLGVFLFYKGLTFRNSGDQIVELLSLGQYDTTFLLIYHYVIFAHIAGGLLIIFGLLTRIATAIHIPLITVALVAHSFQGDVANIALTGFVLVLLVFYTIIGSGRFSVDYKMQLHV